MDPTQERTTIYGFLLTQWISRQLSLYACAINCHVVNKFQAVNKKTVHSYTAWIAMRSHSWHFQQVANYCECQTTDTDYRYFAVVLRNENVAHIIFISKVDAGHTDRQMRHDADNDVICSSKETCSMQRATRFLSWNYLQLGYTRELRTSACRVSR